MRTGPLYHVHRQQGGSFTDVGGVAVARTFGDPANEYLALRREAGLSDLSHLGIVRVSGPDRLSFLQAILSQDLTPLEEPGRLAQSLLLEPRGKVEFGLLLLSLPDDIVLVTEAGQSDALVAGLNRWRIRVKCEISPANDDFGLLEVRGPGRITLMAAEAGAPGVAWDWPGLPGRLFLTPAADFEARWQDLAAVARPVGWEVREAVRIEAGIPRIGPGLDVDDRTIPQEAFLERSMVSFTKGCFLGQELVCRIDSRGHVNRYLRGIVVSDTVLPPVGAEVVSGGKKVGEVTSVGESLDLMAPVCLGYVRREVETPAKVTLRWHGGEAGAEARELPLIG